MAWIVYGAMMAAYAYYVWLLGRLGWGGRTRKQQAGGRLIPLRSGGEQARGSKKEPVPAARLRATGGSPS